jgi:Tfp pilus assembly protein FimT
MNSRGLTVSELVIALVLIGAISAMAVPRLGQSMTKQGMVSARNGVVAMVAKAKASAVQRGSRTTLLLTGGNLVIKSRHPVSGAIDTVGVPENLTKRYGASVAASRDSLVFDPRGLGMESGSTTVVVRKGDYADTLVISAAGRVLR